MFAIASTTIAWIILVLSVIGWATYAFFNVRAGRAEIGWLHR